MTVEPSFEENEKIIERGLHSFVEVGQALMRIRDSRDYKTRAGFPTFEAYCTKRWQMSRTFAHNTIKASETVFSIENIAPELPVPTTEGVARELKGTDQQKAEVWQETVKRHGPKPTAKQTRAVVKEKNVSLTGPEILAWAEKRRASGSKWTRYTLEAESKAGEHGWPGPPEGMSSGTAALVIQLVKNQSSPAEEPKPKTNGRPKNWDGKSNAKRERELREKAKQAAHVGGDFMALVKVQKRINELCSALETVDLGGYDIDEPTLALVADMYDDLSYLAHWHSRALTQAETWLGNSDVLRKIEGLKAKAVDRGATPEEADTARRLVERLERKLNPVVLGA